MMRPDIERRLRDCIIQYERLLRVSALIPSEERTESIVEVEAVSRAHIASLRPLIERVRPDTTVNR